MSLRRSAMPATLALPRELSDLLMRNGMQATIIMNHAGQPQLMVQGHDSPVLTYNLTHQQLSALTAWGSNHLNKTAYNTFTAIVANDFDLPRNFVHANNANTRVAMGLHGYRVGIGEYEREPMMTPRQAFMRGMPMGFGGGPLPHQRGFWQVMTPWLGWTGRHQDGFHLRRIGGMLVTPQGAPIIPERPDGRMRPGELQSGGYGFYWKGGPAMSAPAQGHGQGTIIDPLRSFQPIQSGPGQDQRQDGPEPLLPVRSKEPAKPYNELISSPVYFSASKFLEVLDTHGILVNLEKNEVVIQSSKLDVDITYSLSKEDMAILTSNSLKEHPLEERLAVLNKTLGEDFKEPVTMDMLNSKDRIAIDVNDTARAELAQIADIQQTAVLPLAQEEEQTIRQTIQADGMVIPLISEKEGYHWAQDVSHGRDVVLGNVVAYQNEGKAFLQADINGTSFTKEITAKEFQEIQYRNDERRLELVDMHLDGIHLEHGDYKGEVVNTAVTEGAALDEITRGGKGWYREGRDGREVTVGDISVAKQDNTFVMTAQIDGQTIQHEISQKDFNKFMQMDDLHRMKLFSKIFDEVDIKDNVGIGTKIGAAIAATLTVMGELGSEPMVSLPHGEAHLPHGMGPHPYFKPGVDSPMDIAARNFEAAMITDQIQHGLHH